MLGAYVAATIVSLWQYLRLRDKRLLLLAALFAFQAQALQREWYDPLKNAFQWASCGAGVLLLLAIMWRHPAAPRPAGHHPAEGSKKDASSRTPGLSPGPEAHPTPPAEQRSRLAE